MHSVPPKVPSLWGKLLKDCISKNKSRQLKIFAWGEKRDLITHPACFCSLCLDEFLLLVWFMFLLLLGVFPLAASVSPHWAGLGVLSICWKYADLPGKRGKCMELIQRMPFTNKSTRRAFTNMSAVCVDGQIIIFSGCAPYHVQGKCRMYEKFYTLELKNLNSLNLPDEISLGFIDRWLVVCHVCVVAEGIFREQFSIFNYLICNSIVGIISVIKLFFFFFKTAQP